MRSSPDAPAVVAGGTGFIGRAVLSAFRANGQSATGFSRTQAPGAEGSAIADLSVSESVRRAVDRAATVIHAAPYLGPDERQSESINVAGTQNLIDACAESGVDRLIYVSTSGVLGLGPHRNLSATDAEIAPASARSRHRAEAERIVLAAGGTVVRPNLVYGVGDMWVVPAIHKLNQAIGGIIEQGSALASVIDVVDLAALVAGLHEVPADSIRGRVFHAANPTPVTVRDLTVGAARALGHEPLLTAVAAAVARHTAERIGLTPHQLDMAMSDHWYASEELWQVASVVPLDHFLIKPKHVTWYRR